MHRCFRSDGEIVTSLRALRTPAANAIVKAFGAFGDAITFEQDLRAALIAIGNPVDQRLALAITRLSAEAYLLDIHLFNDQLDAPQGYIDRLDQLELTQSARFLHFAVRRLIELSSAQLSEEMQRGQAIGRSSCSIIWRPSSRESVSRFSATSQSFTTIRSRCSRCCRSTTRSCSRICS